MAKITGTAGNINLFRAQYNKLVAKGEGLIGTDFKMSIEGYEDMSEVLIQATQIPAMMREMIESYGPNGVKFLQAGNYGNSAEVPITFKEVIKGEVYKNIRDWIVNKRYLKVRLMMIPESAPTGTKPLTFVMHDCWLNLDGVDLSVEDRAAIVKPAGTLYANFVDPE